MGLADARGGRDAARAMLADGRDPATAARAEKDAAVAATQQTFEAVTRTWLAGRVGTVTPRYLGHVTRRIEPDLFREIDALPLRAIDTPLLLTVLRKVEARGCAHIVRRLENYTSEVFQFAIPAGLAATDPTTGLGRALNPKKPVKHRAKMTPAQIPGFLADLDRYDGELLTRLALTFTLRTMVRTVETRFAHWSEFEGLDTADPLWRIPPARMKMTREHLVPLTPQIVALLNRIGAVSGRTGHLFPQANGNSVMSENTMLFALCRMGYHSRLTVHGFRGTASTIFNEQGFNRDWIERQLAHVEEDKVRGAYNAAEYLAGLRIMLQWWNDYLDGQQAIAELVG